MKDYIREIKYNIRRMFCYASLIIYCGNNEIEMFMDVGTKDPVGLAQYINASLYFVVLPRALHEEGKYAITNRPALIRLTVPPRKIA